jgi:hypothetical protein
MIPEIGHFSLILALFVAFITGILGRKRTKKTIAMYPYPIRATGTFYG